MRVCVPNLLLTRLRPTPLPEQRVRYAHDTKEGRRVVLKFVEDREAAHHEHHVITSVNSGGSEVRRSRASAARRRRSRRTTTRFRWSPSPSGATC